VQCRGHRAHPGRDDLPRLLAVGVHQVEDRPDRLQRAVRGVEIARNVAGVVHGQRDLEAFGELGRGDPVVPARRVGDGDIFQRCPGDFGPGLPSLRTEVGQLVVVALDTEDRHRTGVQRRALLDEPVRYLVCGARLSRD
jgi:hypothetical protein